ncbi:septal ring lytic transglycosylase RlpA family protein [Rhodospira trueperi]|uniref:Endolytic peptidoglycan transglycosylase RlpA n=1 Tax=Rhodospira trueperi TaxID=69960 RepID=A0A1G6X5Q4_9PROT|nr:septal ring lytic transglycosylase RlpA family protein [Rhodospira trueperi]SDD73429.1 rare lipoprotein A [Rhodospira trueperi]
MTARPLTAPLFVLAAILGMAGCAETTLTIDAAKSLSNATTDSSSQAGHFKVGDPYTINGQHYVPRDDLAYNETGVASWYGPGFHGKSTANGERFDENALTAAHRTLPLPSMVQVTNLDNGRTVVLRVNDRGPFAKDRILDVSKRAAEVLGFRRRGKAPVRVTILAEESLALRTGGGPVAPSSAPPPVAAPTFQMATVYPNPGPGRAPTVMASADAWYIQAGAFSDTINARRVVSSLSALGPAHLSQTLQDGRPLTRVRIGPLPNTRDAARLLQQVQASGYPEARLVAD